MKITKLRTNRMENPLGFQMDSARISYVVEESASKKQEAAQVIVATDEELTQIVYDSGRTNAIDSLCYELPVTLEPRTRYYWQVTVWGDAGDAVTSEVAWFETAKAADEVWQAKFITQTFAQDIHPIIFKDITASKEVKSARAYALGLGVYELYLNGSMVGDEYLLPGIHAYDSWLQYQTFELALKQGNNRLEAYLGDGWYKGAYGLKNKEPRHGDEFAFIAEIHIEYADGSREIIGTDESWGARKGFVQFDSIYDGEVYDATADTTQIFPVKAADLTTDRLQARLSPKITIHERLKPIEIIHTPAGETILDMGQNMVGWLEFKTSAPKGTKIFMQFGEIMQDDCFYRDNLRTALCEYTYIADGTEAVGRAHYTHYGFRFVKIEGWVGALNAEDFTGCVIHSQMEETGSVETSDPMVNQLIQNVRWGMKGNFLDIPTDCPQRDERMGWTGDAQIFCDTACYYMDTYAFYTKFGKDLAYEQEKCGGSVPYVVPMSRYELGGATTWGDAATVIPWQTYLHFGDKTILKQQYDSMKAWVEYMHQEDEKTGGRRLWETGRHFGDWLALDGKVNGGVYGATDIFYIATAYYYYSTDILAKAAKVLGKDTDAAYYQKLAAEVKDAFQKEYFTANGRLSISTQTAYAIAVYMDLIPESGKARVQADFEAKLRENGYLLNTGFVGTPYLCQALSETGLNDLAYRLLLNRKYPSWLYEVEMGATTIWERWNSVNPDGKISGIDMNSLNHYAYGSIMAWVYRYIIGIRPVEDVPGFRKALIKPMPNYRIAHANAKLDTPCGTYKTGWELKDGRLMISVTVPFGAQAQVILPDAEGVAVETTGCPFAGTTYTLDAGTYTFSYVPNVPYEKYYSIESNLNELLQDEGLKAIIEETYPRALKGIPFQNEGTLLYETVHSPFGECSDEVAEELDRKLRAYHQKD